MNPDDPKFTAYALDELDPAERSEIEQMLKDDPSLAAEVAATRAFAAQLRTRLHAEDAESLRPEQRAEVLARVVPLKADNVIAFSRRAAAWSALAACAALGIGLALLLPMLNSANLTAKRTASRASAGTRVEAPRQHTSPDGSEVQVTLGIESLFALGETVTEESNPVSFAVEPAPSPEPPAAPLVNSPDVQKLALNSPTEMKIRPATQPTLRKNEGDLSGTVSGRGLAESTSTVAPLANDPNSGGVAADAYVAPDAKAKAVMHKTLSTTLKAAPAKPRAMSGRMGGATGDDKKLVEDRLALARAPHLDLLTDEASLKASINTTSEAKFSEESETRYSRRQPEAPGTESYDDVQDNPFLKVTDAPLSTFSIDVDTASYANVRRFLNNNQLPPKAAVRIEELVNYFSYNYPQPDGDTPFSTAMEVATCPWAPEHRLLRVALHGRDIQRDARPASNLVFLIDVSGSMQPENKLPLLKRSLQLMVDQLSERDRVSIVVYAGAAGCVLEPTHSKDKIRAALDRLESGGSTHGSAGLQRAYELAETHFIKGGTNRVILATDGDWNVGVTDKGDLWSMIEKKAKSGVFLTVLGFGMDNLKDDMLEKLADKGNGNYAYIDTLNEGRKVLVDELGATLLTIAKDVKIQIEFNPAQVGAYRLIGYENRVLAAKDFADDTKDAGEIGAGHSVTAFYELIPAGNALPASTKIEELKYQKVVQVEQAVKLRPIGPAGPENKELLTLKLRYKAPDGDKSILREFPLNDSGNSFANSSRDFRFATAVAGYGMLLRQSPHKGSVNWALVHELAVEGKGEDPSGYRAEFIGLVEKARAQMR